jgi:hypothetical protein
MHLKMKNPPPPKTAMEKLRFTKYKRCDEITILYKVNRYLNLQPPTKPSFLLSIRNYYTFMTFTTRNKITEIELDGQISTSENKQLRNY